MAYKRIFKEGLMNLSFAEFVNGLFNMNMSPEGKIKSVELSGSTFFNNPRCILHELTYDISPDNDSVTIWPEDNNGLELSERFIKNISTDRKGLFIIASKSNEMLILKFK